MNVPDSLVLLLSLAQNGSLSAPVIIPPFQYIYSAAAVGDKFVVSSCAWPLHSSQLASVEECALTWITTDGNRTDAYFPGQPYSFGTASITGNNLWLISDLLSTQTSVLDFVKLNTNFNLEKAYSAFLPFGSVTIGAYFSDSLVVSAVVLLNATLGIVTLNTTAYSHSIFLLALPDDFPGFDFTVPPTLFKDNTALYIVAFEEGLGVVRVPVQNPSNYSTMVLPNFELPFLEPIYGDQGTYLRDGSVVLSI